ncbi:MAG TPA: PilZ domain-containing protein [Erythrobacter sp.]|nr:PilZ domain-containing protein [Erythrobacter sp.]
MPDAIFWRAYVFFTDLCDVPAMNLNSIPRASERKPMSLMVKSRVRSRVVFVDLLDLSEGGCKLRGKAGFAEVGDRVTMKVGGVNAPLGSVAWVEGPIAGIAFEGAMHPAVIDYLSQQEELSRIITPNSRAV